MRSWWLSLIALVAASASAVPVWRWVDEMGVTHYSDRPVPGAEQIELSTAETISSVEQRSPSPGAERQSAPASQTRTTERYRRFDVTSPGQQETLWNIGSVLNVAVALDPPLQPGHTLDVYLDGQRRNLNATSSPLSVPEVFRGVHTLQAVVVDDGGNEVVRSLAVTFMVQQTSVLNPNNPTPPARAN